MKLNICDIGFKKQEIEGIEIVTTNKDYRFFICQDEAIVAIHEWGTGWAVCRRLTVGSCIESMNKIFANNTKKEFKVAVETAKKSLKKNKLKFPLNK